MARTTRTGIIIAIDGDEYIQRAVRQHALDRDALALSYPVCAILRLQMIGRDPIQVLEHHVRCCGERDANASSDDVTDR